MAATVSATQSVSVVNPSPDPIDNNNEEEWPIQIGFTTKDEIRDPIKLDIVGDIPSYAKGVLYRTGPSTYKVDVDGSAEPYEFQHWFDGLIQVHRFNLEDADEDPSKVKVTYNSRLTVDEVVEKVKKNGDFSELTFGRKRDVCNSFFKKLTSVFKPLTVKTGKSGMPIGITFSANMPGIPATTSSHSAKVQSLITKTDAAWYQKLDPETLEPQGYAYQEKLHPELEGPLSAAHAKTDPETGDIFNFNLDVKQVATYRIWRISPSTGKVDILAKFTGPATYMHSFLITPSAVLICLWGSRFSYKGLSLLWNRNIVDSIAPFDNSLEAQWFVIDRTEARRGVIAQFTSPNFFCFHSVNAYEEPSPEGDGKFDIVADMATYPDLSVIHGFYYKALTYNGPKGEKNYKEQYPGSVPNMARYRLPGVPRQGVDENVRSAKLVSKAAPELTPELPCINPRFSTLPHRYIYGVRHGIRSLFFDGLVKHDMQTGTAVSWQIKGQTPGEPIFIANPEGTEEDDGVLLSVVLDGHAKNSYLLCLNAKTMREVGRAPVPVVIGHGFHGLHVPDQKVSAYNGEY